MNTGKKLQQATDLQELSKISKETQRPILLLFSQAFCESCHRIKDEILNPMLLNEDDTNRVFMREMLIDEGQTFIEDRGEGDLFVARFDAQNGVDRQLIMRIKAVRQFERQRRRAISLRRDRRKPHKLAR